MGVSVGFYTSYRATTHTTHAPASSPRCYSGRGWHHDSSCRLSEKAHMSVASSEMRMSDRELVGNGVNFVPQTDEERNGTCTRPSRS
jgi:hypothetical protein